MRTGKMCKSNRSTLKIILLIALTVNLVFGCIQNSGPKPSFVHQIDTSQKP